MEVPETRYTRTVDGVNIAYPLVGEGPLNFVLVFVTPPRDLPNQTAYSGGRYLTVVTLRSTPVT